jgi:hypothetical protein
LKHGWKEIPSLAGASTLPRIFKGKDKAILIQVWAGLYGSRKVRLPDFQITGT